MRRREFIGIIGSVVAAWPIAARGQQPERMRRIGVLLAGTPTSFAPRANAFVQGLRELGYVEGKTQSPSSGNGEKIEQSVCPNWLKSW
jgi:putative tryptophan/tyrosine transport system substrate-binding protein